MSDLLQRLQIRPIPKKRDVVQVHVAESVLSLPVPDVEGAIDSAATAPVSAVDLDVSAKHGFIVDKTKLGFDRTAFMEKLKQRILVSPKQHVVVPPTDTVKTDTDKSVTKRVKRAVKTGQKIQLKLSKDITKGTLTGTSVERPYGRRTQKVEKEIIAQAMVDSFKLGDAIVHDRTKVEQSDTILAPSYYMNNREVFINFINSLFVPYRDELLEESSKLSCKSQFGGEFSLLTHQKIVRDYLNLYTPYRGLLLYHGLGSGKTCSSIAIAEGMKSTKQITILTPASLRANYIEQLKFCGDMMYKKKQFWEFMDTNEHPEYIDILSQVLSINSDFIKREGGAWMINTTKEANFDALTTEQKASLDSQLNEMMRSKYTFINYNGLRDSHLKTMTRNATINPFDNKVIIIDEAHNFISRVVNKIKQKKMDSLSVKMYEYLMSATNARIVLLTGTPIINYPNETAIMFNILRGHIKTFYIRLDVPMSRKIDTEYFKSLFSNNLSHDYLNYTAHNTTLAITRNPFGYINKWKSKQYKGVALNERGQISDEDFQKEVMSVLQKNAFKIIPGSIQVKNYKALPDDIDEFSKLFFQTGDNTQLTNLNLFKRRILGLTSYFRDIVELMPQYDETTDFHEIKIEMSDDQFAIYEKARQAERKQEEHGKKKRRAKALSNDLYSEDSASTYRIFSRLFCNFVFPADIPRPMPRGEETMDDAIEHANEDILDAVPVEERLANADGEFTMTDTDVLKLEAVEDKDTTYEKRIQSALNKLAENGDKFLSPSGLETYSPKFLHILENILDVDYKGLHLVYSQFRTVEGIGVFKLVLLQNGFAEFKVQKVQGVWKIAIAEEDRGKPTFALYTGTETVEEKEMVRNIFNGTWENVPASIRTELERASSNNHYGEIIKVLMITSSGAEGMNLKNVRYVHLMEPYWHPVRLEQVIGRARRICSHEALLESERNIEVFLYLMTLSDTQKTSDASIELRLKDQSRFTAGNPVTSDETLYEISVMKRDINKQILTAIKEAAIDCVVHNTGSTRNPLTCFTFRKGDADVRSYQPNYATEERDDIRNFDTETITWSGKRFKLGGKTYALRMNPDGSRTDEVYDFESFNMAMKNPGVYPTYMGRFVRKGKKIQIIRDV